MVIGRKTADCPPHAAESLWFQGLAPVVHQKNVCPIVGRQIGLVHRNSLNVSTESSRKHLPIRLTPVEVDARFHSVQTALCCERFTPIEQTLEHPFRMWPEAGCRKLDIASISAGFGGFATMANRESIQRVSALQ
jgi:hypothetical protein